jgi:hypothetical protein
MASSFKFLYLALGFCVGWLALWGYLILLRYWEAGKKARVAWHFDRTSWLQLKCPNCGRERVTRCMNGLLLCEKCDYSPDLGRVITDEENPGYSNLIAKNQRGY